MERKQQQKEDKLNLVIELSKLINKTVLFDRNLLSIVKINSIYIYAKNFKCNDELVIDNNIIFFFI